MLKNRQLLKFPLLILFLLFFIGATSRSISVKIKTPGGEEIPLYGESYALIIGCSDYSQGWPDLRGVSNDIKLIENALSMHGFEVTVVTDPDSASLKKAYEGFIRKYGREESNRLLFYFAGHGYTLKQSYGAEMGYIVPVDAPIPDQDRNGFLDRALDMQMIEVYAKRIQSRHALFVFDSCFSGSVFDIKRSPPPSISHKIARPVRQLITSGSADEEVPDKSIFCLEFADGIKGSADLNKDGYVTGTELGEYLTDKVINYSRGTQHPNYGKIRDRNLDKGDFVFTLAGSKPGPEPPDYERESKRLEEERARLEQERQELQRLKELELERRRIEEERKKIEAEKKKLAMGHGPEKSEEGMRETWKDPVTGMEFVWVPGGCYQMGCGSWDGDCDDDEKPVHEVCVDGFWIGRYEVTQGQWQKVMGSNPSNFKKGDNYPVEQVSWNDTKEFIQKLNFMSNSRFEFRLPTEAEWEYAARSGGKPEKYSGSNNVSVVAWHSEDWNSGHHEVGGKSPNGLGIYDMSGNVWEWCEDIYSKDAYSSHQRNNPIYTGGGSYRVIRGGSWCNFPRGVRCADRNNNHPDDGLYSLGFRLVRAP